MSGSLVERGAARSPAEATPLLEVLRAGDAYVAEPGRELLVRPDPAVGVRRLALGDLAPPTGNAPAIAAFPFESDEEGWVVAPGAAAGRDSVGTRILAGEPAAFSAERAPLPEHPQGAGPPRPLPPDPAFRERLGEAVARVRSGELDKIVLSRCITVALPRPLDLAATLHRWRALEPRCAVFAVPLGTGGSSVFVGASPELLLARHGTAVVSRPLAGTAPAGPDPEEAVARLLASAKDATEHRLVVEAITGVLRRFAEPVVAPASPSVMSFHRLTHLATEIRGVLREPLDPRAVVAILAALHPTPAVGGVPSDAARRVIRELEGAPRGPYAGPVGWIDPDGDASWHLGIRSAVLGEPDASGAYTVATLHAGAGIVAASDPDAEDAEVAAKLRSTLEVLTAPPAL